MIRKYIESDYETLVDIANRAYAKIYEGFRERLGEEIFSILCRNSFESKAAQIRNHVNAYPDFCYVAERNGKIVGFITFGFNRNIGVGVISNNAADPDSGEKGVGQEMYAAVLERFRSEGMRLAQVTTGLDEAHAPARRAYERAGFREHKESVTYYLKLSHS